MRVLAFLDGTLADPDQPHIRVDDLGLMRGDGIFETVLVADGVPRELGPHLDRLARSAAMLDLPEPDRAAWERVAQIVIDNWRGSPELALKLVYTRGIEGDPEARPTGFALGMEIDEKVKRARAEGIAAITLERGIEPDLAARAPWLLLGAKSLSYAVNMAGVREAARRGAADVIFTATDGSVLEGPTSNVILARGRTLYTPPPAIGILPGTTQRAVFRAAERAGWATKIEPLTVEELDKADGLFLSSSVRKLTRVHTLDGNRLPDSTGLHAELAQAYDAEYART
ncbi:aminodeoxychorismate lyase [Prauserella muralis]|uniref:4-amino-4-deoxychorismate lyase n=1 Tax=Prauserella muralis TaxID=588067 RepID=A0A2V4B7W5_9PSEU|nr:aminodeoxychorismate lyase [Prauserella muralis]PXY31424.1 4-amino-4-deoxychorismate lyase [Prauserella muralis]TWE14242.1 4-amino-4-deoxychorismate lyase [Prauserella muralis]